MKKSFILLLIIGVLSCAETPNERIVGVWEMTAVIVPSYSKLPPVALTNKKDIFTKDGLYHNTSANSDKITDVGIRKFTIENDEICIISDRGVRRSKFEFLPINELMIIDTDGSKIIFMKLSNDYDKIPVIKERVIKPTIGKR